LAADEEEPRGGCAVEKVGIGFSRVTGDDETVVYPRGGWEGQATGEDDAADVYP